jgi:hypothetical protein
MRVNHFYKKILLGSFIFFPLLSCMNTVKAEEASTLGLSVNPQLFELDVFPGETINRIITVGNLSDVVLPVKVRVVNFTAADYSGEMLFEEILADPAVASKKWFEVEPADFILDIGERRVINFSISVPEDAVPGGHYSVILFEPQLPSHYFKAGQPQMVPVVGVLFLISVKVLALEPISQENLVEIVEFRIPGEQRIQNLERFLASVSQIIPPVQAAEINISERTPSSFILSIKNNDIYHHKLSGRLLVYNTFGKRVGEIEIKKTTILPGKIRRFPVNFSSEAPGQLKWLPASIANFLMQNTSLGKYRAVLELGEEKSKIEVSQALTFWIFSWKLILPLFFISIFLIIIRRRLLSAFRVLLDFKFK